MFLEAINPMVQLPSNDLHSWDHIFIAPVTVASCARLSSKPGAGFLRIEIIFPGVPIIRIVSALKFFLRSLYLWKLPDRSLPRFPKPLSRYQSQVTRSALDSSQPVEMTQQTLASWAFRGFSSRVQDVGLRV